MNTACIHFIELFEKLGIKIFRIMCDWVVIVSLNSERFIVFHLPHEESSIFIAVIEKATWKVTAIGFLILVKASSCILYFYKKTCIVILVLKKSIHTVMIINKNKYKKHFKNDEFI
jgi:hypothetical protein